MAGTEQPVTPLLRTWLLRDAHNVQNANPNATGYGQGLAAIYARALLFAYAVKDPLLCVFISMLPTHTDTAASRDFIHFFAGTLHFRAVNTGGRTVAGRA